MELLTFQDIGIVVNQVVLPKKKPLKETKQDNAILICIVFMIIVLLVNVKEERQQLVSVKFHLLLMDVMIYWLFDTY